VDFSTTYGFLARNLKITWTDKDLKGKENIKRKDRGKRLEERENHLSKGENMEENIKERPSRKKILLFPLYFRLLFWLPLRVFLFIMQN